MAIHKIRRAAALIPGESGQAQASAIYVNSSSNTLKYVPAATGTTEAELWGSVAGSATGYTQAGVGGAVTQITTSATGVTLSKPCGQITTVALTTAAAAEERFTVTNTLIAATDTISLGTTYAGAGTPALSVMNIVAGAFDLVITNLHAANALNAALIANFAIIKSLAA